VARRCVATWGVERVGCGARGVWSAWGVERVGCGGSGSLTAAPLVLRKCVCTTSMKWKVYSLKSVKGWMWKATIDLTWLNARI
jgi:hypothetical protein